MIEFVTSRWLGDFLFGFSALFAIINPYGLAFIFH
jgi:multiple antibiotic resistance protein